MGYRERTIETYDVSARALAEYFKGIGPRSRHIDKGLELWSGPALSANIVEIGCGDGRDAADITTKVDSYIGLDISQGMISIAREKLPDQIFEVSGAAEYDYPENVDVVFAFASILHLDQEELSIVFDKVHRSLKQGGVFYISTKTKPVYEEALKSDEYGERLFFFYNPELIKEVAGRRYDVVFEEIENFSNTNWLEIAFKKT